MESSWKRVLKLERPCSLHYALKHFTTYGTTHWAFDGPKTQLGLLAFRRLPVKDVIKLYEELGSEVFQQSYLKAVTGIVKSQSYYDTSKYEAILKEQASDEIMAETVRQPDCPKVAFVAAIMSSSRHSVTPFIFRYLKSVFYRNVVKFV